MITQDSTVKQGNRAVYRDLREGGVVLHLDTAAYYRVNATGRLLWSLLEGRTVGEIVDEFRGRFDDPPADVEDDVLEFLGSLQERRLIEVS
ncbi:MAG TPA: PqqD family protein [Acidimicrobiia bacterium]